MSSAQSSQTSSCVLLIVEAMLSRPVPLLEQELVEEVGSRGGCGTLLDTQAGEGLLVLKQKGVIACKQLNSTKSAVVYYPGKHFWTFRQHPECLSEKTTRRQQLRQEADQLVVQLWERNQYYDSFLHSQEEVADRVQQERRPPEKRRKITHTLNAQVEEESKSSQVPKELELKKMEALHKYNEVKDLAHKLLGILAEASQCTVKQLYESFNIEQD
ncbi:hypothetical protein QOT17_015157 [Balamuthia mandrillaris]